jgi:DNA-binding XRE family transcriptional regulator
MSFAHGGRRAGGLVSTVESEQAGSELGPTDTWRERMMLLREAIGDRLRRTRTSQHRTLREVSRVARVSLGYLSEVERGRKEPSSELLASICDALDLPLDELLRRVADDLGPVYLPEVPATLAAELVAA